MAAPVVIVPPPPEALPADPSAPSNLFTTYNPHGAHEGLFVPPYIPGFEPSETAVAKWSAGHGGDLTHEMIDQDLRMPDEWAPPQPQQMSRGDGVYGGNNIPLNLTLGKNSKGTIDIAALKALSHGTAYDTQARRDSIAARLLANQTAEDDYNRRQPTAPGERGQSYLDYYNEFQKSQMEGFEPLQNKSYY